ncbi:MAG: PAS domain S-box protein, partial [Planctomycetota bacterium]
MEKTVRKTGIDIIGDVPWGTHFCQFYQTKQDLIDILVPYFKAGLANNEFCMWITSEPLHAEEAKGALSKEVKNLDAYIAKGQIEILDFSQWYTKSGGFNASEVLEGWVRKEEQAVKNGFDGLRLTGNTFWLEKRDWESFKDYEAVINRVIGKYRMLAICTYSLERCTASEVVDVVSNHQFTLIKRQGKWEIIESAEHKKTMETLQQSEERYRNVYDTTPLAFVVWDNNCSVTGWNKRAEDMFGWSQEEVMGKNFFNFLIPESERPHVGTVVQALLEGRLPSRSVNNNLTKNGRMIFCEWNNAILRDANGEVTGAISMGLDITERKQAEEAIQKSEANYRSIFDTANDAIFIHDTESGKILSVNQKACEMFGYAQEELQELTVKDISTGVPPYDQEHAVGWIKKAAREGPQLFEWVARRKNGQNFWIEVNLKLAVI